MTYARLNPSINVTPLFSAEQQDDIDFRCDMAWLRVLAGRVFTEAVAHRAHPSPVPMYCDLEEETRHATGIDPLWPADLAALCIAAWKAETR